MCHCKKPKGSKEVEYFEFKETVDGGHICVGDTIQTCIGNILIKKIVGDCDTSGGGVKGLDEHGDTVFVPHGEIYGIGECW